MLGRKRGGHHVEVKNDVFFDAFWGRAEQGKGHRIQGRRIAVDHGGRCTHSATRPFVQCSGKVVSWRRCCCILQDASVCSKCTRSLACLLKYGLTCRSCRIFCNSSTQSAIVDGDRRNLGAPAVAEAADPAKYTMLFITRVSLPLMDEEGSRRCDEKIKSPFPPPSPPPPLALFLGSLCVARWMAAGP